MCAGRLYRSLTGHALYAAGTLAQQLIRAVFNPARDSGVGGTAVGGVVLEAAVFRRIVRGRNDNAVGKMFLAPAVVGQNGSRDDRRGSKAVALLDDGLDSVGGQHFQRGALRRGRQRVAVLPHVKRAVRTLMPAIVADGLRDRQNVSLGKGAVQRGTAVTAGPEDDPLTGVADIGTIFVVRALQASKVYQHRFRRRLARQG